MDVPTTIEGGRHTESQIASGETTDKMTLQNPKPPEDTALRNFDFDFESLDNARESNDFKHSPYIFPSEHRQLSQDV